MSLCLIVSYYPSLFAHHSSEYRRGIGHSNNHGNTIKLSATRDSSDGSSVSDKLSFRASIDPCDAGPPYTESPEGPLPPASSSSLPSFAPPPFSSLYFPPPASPDRLEASITEPLSDPPPAFSPVRPAEAAVAGTTSVEAETKAALPADNKGESSKSAEESEPPPPYTEGSSPLDSFTYVMAAAGGAASIITQVQQGGPAPVNTLAGTNMKGCQSCAATISFAETGHRCRRRRAYHAGPKVHRTNQPRCANIDTDLAEILDSHCHGRNFSLFPNLFFSLCFPMGFCQMAI